MQLWDGNTSGWTLKWPVRKDRRKETEDKQICQSPLKPNTHSGVGESQCWDTWPSSHHIFRETYRSILIQDVINSQPSDLRVPQKWVHKRTQKKTRIERQGREQKPQLTNVCWVHTMNQTHTMCHLIHFTEKLGFWQVTSLLRFSEIKRWRQVWNPSSLTP